MLLIYVFIIMKRNLSFFIFFFTISLGVCQISNLVANDFQSWNNVGFEYQKINKTEISIESGIRFDNNLQDLSKFLTDIIVKREFNKYLDYAIGLRYDRRRKNHVLEERLRWYFDCYLGYKIYPNITLKSRTRYQLQRMRDDLFSGAAQGSNDLNFLTKKIRQKITLSHRKNKKTNIFISSEVFHELGLGWEKFRLNSGLKKKITKNISLTLSWLFQSDFGNGGNKSFFAFRTKLNYTIK